MALPPACDYRVLHTCRDLYVAGLHLYFKLNTFSISLREFEECPLQLAGWPRLTGQPLAAKFCRSLHLAARPHGNWHAAVRCLRAFEDVRSLVFDTRSGIGLDDGPGGEMRWSGWAEVDAGQALLAALELAGLGGIERVRVGGNGVEEAHRLMEHVLPRELMRGVAQLELEAATRNDGSESAATM